MRRFMPDGAFDGGIKKRLGLEELSRSLQKENPR